MSREGIFLMFILMVLVLILVVVYLHSMLQPKEQIESQPSKPRLILPTDKNKKVYTFTLDSELKSEEWEMILNAGWSFITCTTEQRKEYANCGPESPSYFKTYWHYVFHQNKQ